MMKIAPLSLAVLCLSIKVFAAAPDYTIHQDFTSTRALGMGNAFIAVADDHNSLFYNPATLALREDSAFRAFLRAGIDGDYLDFADDLKSAEGQTTQETVDVITKYYGKHLYSRVPTLGGVWVRPRWGIGFVPADLSIDVVPNNLLGPSIGVNAYLDTTLAYGYGRFLNWGKLKKQLAVGATVKGIHRVFYSEVINAGSLAQGDEVFEPEKSAEGFTVDMDIGLIYRPEIKKNWIKKHLNPTFALVARNVADYGFPMQFKVVNENNPKKPDKLQRRLDAGMKLDLYKLWVFDPKFALDIKDIGHDNWTFRKGFHMGTELYWTMYRWWKGHWSVGINQGYMTAGFGARLGIFQLDLATWGEEVGTKDVELESRRYMVELSIDI